MDEYEIINYTDCSEQQQREICNLRNLPQIRKWMTNPEPIEWHEHLDFISRLSQDGGRQYYAVYKGGSLVGTYNLTKVSGTTWERGIITSPAYQGTGVTAAVEQWIISRLPKDKYSIITAKVKLDNLRSICYHEKVGYQEAARDSEYIYYKYKV